MTQNRQLLLDIRFPKLKDWKDFYVSDSNNNAVFFLQNFCSMNLRCLLIYGEEGSGKTHLASLWAKSLSAMYITKDICTKYFVSEVLSKNDFFIIDGCELIEKNEEWFFHFFNEVLYSVSCEMKKILILDRMPVSCWNIRIPDLLSRLLTINSVEITQPDNKMLLKIANKLFFEYGIKISDAQLSKIVENSSLSYKKLINSVTHIVQKSIYEKYKTKSLINRLKII